VKKFEVIILRLNPQLKKDVVALAKRDRRSITETIRIAIDQLLASSKERAS
jgi:hypothetical protein